MSEHKSLSEEFEAQVAKLPEDIRAANGTLIALGREFARQIEDGQLSAGSRLRMVLTDLHKLTDRWERLTMPPAVPQPEPEVSALDELRARREQREA